MPLNASVAACRQGVLPPPDALGEKCYNITSSFRVTGSCPFHKSPSVCPAGWQRELDHSLELDSSLPDQGLAVNPSASSRKAATWAKQICALPCGRVSCCFGFPCPLSCRLVASLQAWLLPPRSAIPALAFGSHCVVP